jgi:exosortase/archaeosortase family protein
MTLARFDLDRFRAEGPGPAGLRAWLVDHRRWLPAVGLVLAALIAYHYTLSTMFDYLVLDTPLAYLPLLPLFALGIAYFTVWRYRGTPQPNRDRQLDLLIGIPLLAVAVALITVVPTLASTYYWTDRADVLSLAFFAAGGVIVLYGTTWFWRLRSALLFLVLMWPALYLHVLAGVMQSFTDATNGALAAIVQRFGALGVTLSGGEGNLTLQPLHNGTPLLVNVGTACSGANSVLGFALIGGAMLTMMRGGFVRKLSWLVTGLLLCFLLNIVRLVSILGLARLGHPELALGGYHAVIGLVLFAVATLTMMSLIGRFGLSFREPVVAGARSLDSEGHPWTRRRFAALGAFAATVLLLFAADSQLAPYAAFADGSGVARVDSFPSATLPTTWLTSHVDSYTWAKQYFGENSSFDRYTVTSSGHGLVYADVVRTDDRSSLDAYNLQNCFLFHDYNISTSRRIDLGNGVTGLLLNYDDPSTKSRWATVSWAWPVQYKGSTYFERIALTSSLFTGSATAGPDVQPNGDGLRGMFLDLVNTFTGGGNQDASLDAVYGKADVNLESVATSLVTGTIQHN